MADVNGATKALRTGGQDKLYGHVSAPYVSISFTDSKGVEQDSLTMDLSSKAITGVNRKPKRPDYFISLTVNKLWQQAMTVKAKITYVPSATSGDPDDYKDISNPNKVDYLLATYGGECYIQYGWSVGNLCPPMKVLFTGYKASLQKGAIMYDLEGVAKAVLYNYKRITIKPNKKETTAETVKRIFEADSSLASSYKLDEKGIEEALKGTVSSKTDSMVGSPLKVLVDYVSTISVQTSGNSSEENKNSTIFSVIIDDSVLASRGGLGQISIKKIQVGDFIGNAAQKVVSFNWNSVGTGENDSNDVISWSPSYDGSAIIYQGIATYNKEQEDDTEGTEESPEASTASQITSISFENGLPVVTSNGSPKVEPTSDFFTTSSLRGACQTRITEDWWNSQLGFYSYKAELTVIGRVDSGAVGSQVIYVQPLLGCAEHISAGYYLITEITDSVSSSGFTTTYGLNRLSYTVDPTTGKLKYNLQLSQNGTLTALGQWSGPVDSEDISAKILYNGTVYSPETFNTAVLNESD